MNPEWKEFLQDNGAEFVTHQNKNSDETSDKDTNSKSIEENELEQFVYFGNSENEKLISTQDLLLCNPIERGLIKVSGEDAETFLQNQLTNDMRNKIS